MIEEIEDLDMLIETSWEVCNKVGGIYTVLSTKSKTLHSIYGDKLVFIGNGRLDKGKAFTFFQGI